MTKDYRLYFLNDAGHIVDAADLICDTDGQARFAAERQGRERAWELWSRDRLVHVNEGLGQASLRA